MLTKTLTALALGAALFLPAAPALAQTRSFTHAFEIAKELVAKQEAAEGLQPSRPQIWVGPEVAARLKKLADRPNQ